jgi:hypothetical protein
MRLFTWLKKRKQRQHYRTPGYPMEIQVQKRWCLWHLKNHLSFGFEHFFERTRWDGKHAILRGSDNMAIAVRCDAYGYTVGTYKLTTDTVDRDIYYTDLLNRVYIPKDGAK